tara:strand:+ start:682 stop:1314 length:633 start_codon:yes stop_codon:yes gene_type:complete
MNLEYKYWYFEKGLPSTICNDVIKHALAKKTQNKAGTLSIDARKKLNKKQAKDLKKYRNSNIVWLKDQWIFDAIIPFVNTANKKAGWNFEIDKAETIQFTIYKKGHYYNYHQDNGKHPYNTPINPDTHGKIRKLSVTVSLNDASEYKGGELQFLYHNQKDYTKLKKLKAKEIKRQGSVVVFPSFEFHAITPVTKGTRYSLVMWCIGSPFK